MTVKSLVPNLQSILREKTERPVDSVPKKKLLKKNSGEDVVEPKTKKNLMVESLSRKSDSKSLAKSFAKVSTSKNMTQLAPRKDSPTPVSHQEKLIDFNNENFSRYLNPEEVTGDAIRSVPLKDTEVNPEFEQAMAEARRKKEQTDYTPITHRMERLAKQSTKLKK